MLTNGLYNYFSLIIKQDLKTKFKYLIDFVFSDFIENVKLYFVIYILPPFSIIYYVKF